MDTADPQTLTIAAAAIGGAVVFGLVSSISSWLLGSNKTSPRPEPKAPVTAQPKKKDKKSKKKKPKKKKAVAKVEKESPKSILKSAEATSPKKVTVQEPEKPEEKKKKKKKKKSKKKKPVVVEEESSDDEDFAPKKATKKEEVKVALEAADFFDASKVDDNDGWTTIPVKRRAKKATVNVEGTEGQPRRDKREVVSIGENVGIVLGEGGSTITNIQNVSGAKVTVNRDSQLCVITGDEESVAVAKQLVVSLVSNQSRHTFTVTKRLDKAILAKPDTRKTIKELSGARLDYNFGATRDDPLTVIVSGETAKVEEAKSLINSYLDGKTPEGGDGIKRIKVTAFQGRILIGVKGAQINNFQNESGASINVEFMEDSKLAIVSVIGDEEQITSGLSLIQTFLLEHNAKGSVELEPGARGVLQKLNDLRKEIPNLQIDVSNDKSEILLCGSAGGIRKGNELLRTWIAKELGPPELRSGQVMETIELGSAAGKVIGKNRSTINNIISNTGAKIEIKKGTLCYVYGKPASVKKAFKDVSDIVAKHEEIVARSQHEQQELQSASWVVVPEDPSSLISTGSIAPESDWGGFKLAQAQGW